MKRVVGRSGSLFFCLLLVTGLPAHADNLRPGTEAFSRISENGSGTFDYQIFTFAGFPEVDTAPALNMVDFYLPYFSDMGLANIQPPGDWTYSIEKGTDIFRVGGGVLHFSTRLRDDIVQDYGLVFSFQSAFNGINSPYLHRLAGTDASTVDYNSGIGWQLVPGSPMARAAFASPVPELSNPVLLLAGLALLGAWSLRRHRRAG